MATCKLGEKGCWKDGKCHFSHNCENKIVTNADRIRAMNDDTLAWQLVQMAREAIKAITDVDLPDEMLDRMWSHFLEKLKQPAEGE